MGNAGNGYIFAGGDFQRTYPMTGVFRWNPSTGDLQVYYNGWKSITVGGGGGTEYTAGNGISIVNDVISIDTSKVALKTELFSGSYNDLIDKPAIPTKTSQLINDSDFVTQNYVDGLVGDINSVLDDINGEVI